MNPTHPSHKADYKHMWLVGDILELVGILHQPATLCGHIGGGQMGSVVASFTKELLL